MKSILLLALILIFGGLANAQSSLSISAPTIWSNIKVKDNWTPPTTPPLGLVKVVPHLLRGYCVGCL
ncbi:MAG: hypothetical protein QY309_07110 [Cyclobacteriaceae bacterium]|nr:MAG: hypothetical protein QY309_07110 [Cyclobacteriaceae bacterium]